MFYYNQQIHGYVIQVYVTTVLCVMCKLHKDTFVTYTCIIQLCIIGYNKK
jgi:hypothetical protein